MQLHSEAFGPNERIPEVYTADGENHSPPLNWTEVPEETRELVLLVDDPDAPSEEPFVHWVAYHISPEAILPEGVEPTDEPGTVPGMRHGLNSFGHIGYDGPAPPQGHGVHHYHFRLYALDTELPFSGSVERQAVDIEMEGHVLEECELVGVYER